MSLVRPLQPDDVGEVTRLYRRVFGDRRGSGAVEADVRGFYLDWPFREADIPSLVHVNDLGRPTGFIGVHTVPFRIDSRRVRAAFCSAFLSANHDREPLAGARLLKAYLNGPQDLSLSETANPTSQAMWERLRGTVLAPYSMEWLRVLRPAGFALAYGSVRLRPLRLLQGLGGVADRMVTRGARARSSPLRFVPAPDTPALVRQDTDRAGFAALVRHFSQDLAATPDWSDDYLDHVLDTGLDKPAFGKPVMAAVRTKGGEPIGAFLYHLRSNGIGRVLQVLYRPGRAGAVLDQLFVDAVGRGAVALRGRTDPAILAAAPGRHLLCHAASSTVIFAKDTALLAPFLAGDCLLNGLVGERWSRFFGAA